MPRPDGVDGRRQVTKRLDRGEGAIRDIDIQFAAQPEKQLHPPEAVEAKVAFQQRLWSQVQLAPPMRLEFQHHLLRRSQDGIDGSIGFLRDRGGIGGFDHQFIKLSRVAAW